MQAPKHTLLPRRTPRWVALLGALVLAGLGAWFASRGERAGLVLVAFFGPLAALCAVTLLPGSCGVSISAEGLRLRSLFVSCAYRWSDMAGFTAVRYRGQPMVAYRFRSHYPQRPLLRALSRALWGHEGAIMPVRDLSVEELARLLEQHRREADA